MKKSKIILFVFILFFSWLSVGLAKEHPQNGSVKESDGQGRLKTILQYKKDKLFRKKVYHENGQLISDTIFKGTFPIVIKTYYLNGQLKSVWTQKSAEARFYYPTGNHKVTVRTKNPESAYSH